MKNARLLVCLAILMLIPFVVSAQTTSYFHYTGEPGEYVSGGQDQTFTPADGTFIINRGINSNQLQFIFYTPTHSHNWQLLIEGPNNTLPQVGTYNDAWGPIDYDRTHPFLYVFGDARACERSTGSFTVRQVTYAHNGSVLTLWVTFAQTCKGKTAVMTGEVLYNVDLVVPTLPTSWGQLKSIYR